MDCVPLSKPPGSFTSHLSGEDGFASCTNDGVCDATPMEAGGALEPGQRLSTGPRVLTKPVFVSVKTLRQAAQAALDVLGTIVRPSSVFSMISDSCKHGGNHSHLHRQLHRPSPAGQRSRPPFFFHVTLKQVFRVKQLVGLPPQLELLAVFNCRNPLNATRIYPALHTYIAICMCAC